jgi:glycyl-tRNA synthetase beta chain
LPGTTEGCVVAVADRLDSLGQLVRAGEKPTGSRDPFGLRRAASGVFRIVLERRWPLSLNDLLALVDYHDDAFQLLLSTLLENFLKERGYTVNEVRAALRPRVSATDSFGWHLHDIAARLEALRTVRARADFTQLVNLTKRVDNILSKDSEASKLLVHAPPNAANYVESENAALQLRDKTARYRKRIEEESKKQDYNGVIEVLAEFVQPVDRFFDEVLVLDPDHPEATWHRWNLLLTLRNVLTCYFDVRELAGQADRRP